MDTDTKAKSSGKTTAMTFRFTEARVKWLKTHAKGLRRSVISIIEEALDEYQARQDKPAKPK